MTPHGVPREGVRRRDAHHHWLIEGGETSAESTLAATSDRVRLRADGRILDELKTVWRDGIAQLLFEPIEFIEKLAAIIPRPAVNLLMPTALSWKPHGLQGRRPQGVVPGARARDRRVVAGPRHRQDRPEDRRPVAAVRVLRGPAHGQRAPRRPPHRGAGGEGHHPALPADAGPPRPGPSGR